MSEIEIALADDHLLFRKGIAALISQLPRYRILFEANNGEEVLAKVKARLKPSIMLLDISMPKMDGIATAEWLHENHPEIKVIVLSMHNEADKVIAMLKLGVKGYLLKDAQPAEFEDALNKVANGLDYFPGFVTKYLVNNLNPQTPKHTKLNRREIEFLKLAATELTYKEIAEKMCLSLRTIDGYRDALFEKLGIKNRVGLVLYAVKNKYIIP